MEVIYTGIRQTPEQIAAAALQEDVDAVGLSILSGAHNLLFPRIRELMDAQGLEDVILFGGGIIPEEDARALKAKGVDAIFTPGAPLDKIVAYVREAVEGRRAGKD
jgi:methylmalonyl-CoA mutase C-terminal domain/subunit